MLLFLRFLLFLSFFCITWVKIGERGIDLPCRPWFSSDKTPAPCPLVHSHLLPSYHHIPSEFSLIVFCLPPLPPLLSARPVHSGIVPLFIPCAVNERGAFLYWGLGADPVIVGCTVDNINNLVLHVQHSNTREKFPVSGPKTWSFWLPPCTWAACSVGPVLLLAAGHPTGSSFCVFGWRFLSPHVLLRLCLLSQEMPRAWHWLERVNTKGHDPCLLLFLILFSFNSVVSSGKFFF